jgi:hypothetical protein
MFPINHDNPRSTAAAALALAATLAPDLEAGDPGMCASSQSATAAGITGRLEGRRLFDDQTIGELRRIRAEIEAAVERETVQGARWVPVCYIDGVEEFEPVAVRVRSSNGDALADVGGRLDRLVALIERTRMLLVAERAIGRRR